MRHALSSDILNSMSLLMKKTIRNILQYLSCSRSRCLFGLCIPLFRTKKALLKVPHTVFPAPPPINNSMGLLPSKAERFLTINIFSAFFKLLVCQLLLQYYIGYCCFVSLSCCVEYTAVYYYVLPPTIYL